MKNESEKAQLALAKLIRTIVLVSAAVILIGLLLYLFTGASGYENNTYPTDLLTILSGAASLKPYAIMLTGLFILILTPIFRVGASIFVFFKDKDKLYVLISSAVFVILIISFLLGNTE